MKSTLLFLIIAISLFGNNGSRLLNNQLNKNFFIENKGQWPQEVRYLAKIGGMNAWITNSGVVYDYFQIIKNYNESETLTMTPAEKDNFEWKNTSRKGHVVKMRLVDANTSSVNIGSNKQQGYYNYFHGNDKTHWNSNVSLFGDIALNEIYNGVNVKYYFDKNSVRYDYIVKPGADLSQLKLKFEGQESIRINDQGEIVTKTSLGEVTNGKLYSYQNNNGIKNEVECKFIQNPDGTVGINTTGYDKTKELIIDPLVYSTFIGGDSDESGVSIAIDPSGDAIITGTTTSSDYPVTLGAYQTTYGGGANDVIVTKLDPSGSSLVYSTLMGGSGYDQGASITVDLLGNAYITGNTYSTNFPTTTEAFQTTSGGETDGFVTKLSPSGAIVYSTFIGGNDEDYCWSIKLDASRNAYITGHTASSNFPIIAGAYKTTLPGQISVFVAKLNPAGSGLVYSTYIGGTFQDFGKAIAVDASGNAFITGSTISSDFPVTYGAYQTTMTGGENPFVTKLNAAGTALSFSTFIGNSFIAQGTSIAVNSAGNAFITGFSDSPGFPTTTGAYKTTSGGAWDVFVSEFNIYGSALVYSTFLGGSENDVANSIAVDINGNAYIAGYTNSADFPSTPDSYQPAIGGNSDAFISELNSTGSGIKYSTFVGKGNKEDGNALAIDVTGNIYLTGYSASSDFPVTQGAFQDTMHGNSDAFVFKLNILKSDSTAKWVSQISGVNYDLSSVSAIDNNTCWIGGGNGTVLLTTNGGAVWNYVGSDSIIGLSNSVDNIFGLDANTCFASVSSSTTANVYKTTDAGKSWVQVFSQPNGYVDAVFMSSPSNGFLVGDPVNNRWSLWKTTDGGSTWDSTGLFLKRSYSTEAGWNNSLYIDGPKIWFGTNNYRIYYSSNNGLTWSVLSTSSIQNLYSIHFNGANGLAGSDANYCYTTNGGTKWILGSYPSSNGAIDGITGFDSSLLLFCTNTGSIYCSGSNNFRFTNVDSISGSVYLSASTARTGSSGNYSVWSVGKLGIIRKGVVNQLTSVNDFVEPVSSYYLSQNYPNPFNPSTTINYSLPHAGNVKLTVYNVIGAKVATIVNEYKPAGRYSVHFNGNNLASGLYLYRLESGNNSISKKFVLLK